jgi:hypothetical protein
MNWGIPQVVMRGNPNPKHKFKQADVGQVAKTPISVKLPIEVDEWIRELPNRTEWLRQAITEKYEREQAQQP